MASDATLCTTLQHLAPEHLRLIALRLQGHSWSKCALHLGVDRSTVYRWREEFPEIDRLVFEDAFDEVIASRIRMASMHKLADEAIEQSLQATKTIVVNEGKETREIPDFPTRLAASDRVKKPFEKLPQPTEQPPPIPAGGHGDERRGRILDASNEDDAELDAELARRFRRGDSGMEAEGMDER